MSSSHQSQAFVSNLFDRIAGRYDLLNRVISFRLDRLWRHKTVLALELPLPDSIVIDLGTGTGDLALEASRVVGEHGLVLGLDPSWPMLQRAQIKTRRTPDGGRSRYIRGDAIAAPLADASADAVISSFVLRNVPDLEKFFAEAYRVLKPGGTVATVDMFPPPRGVFACLYWIYFGRIMPWIGAGLAGDHEAYCYLSDSVRNFTAPERLAQLMHRVGFDDVQMIPHLCGAVCLHRARKPR